MLHPMENKKNFLNTTNINNNNKSQPLFKSVKFIMKPLKSSEE